MGKSRLFRFTPTNDSEVKSRSSLSDHDGSKGSSGGPTEALGPAGGDLSLGESEAIAQVNVTGDRSSRECWENPFGTSEPRRSRISLQLLLYARHSGSGLEGVRTAEVQSRLAV